MVKWCHFSCNLWSIYFFTWTTARSDSGLYHWRNRRYTTSACSRRRPWQIVTAILKLWNGWSRVVMCNWLHVSMAWNGPDMSQERRHWTTVLGPSPWCCGLCIFWTGPPLCWFFLSCLRGCWRQVAFARTTRHLQDWNLPSDIEKSTKVRVDLFKVERQSLVAIVLVLPFRRFLLLSRHWVCHWHHLDGFWSFIVGHGCQLSPGCINSEVDALRGQSSLSFAASSAKEKNNMKPKSFLPARVGKKAKKRHWL